MTLVAGCLLLQAAGTPARGDDGAIGSVREIYDGRLFPDVAVNTYRNIDRLFPVRVVERGESVYPLPPAEEPLTGFHFEHEGKRYDLYDFVALNDVTGLLIVRDGRKLLELYQAGNDANTRWMSMSIVKSMTATLVGAAIEQGHIESIDDPVTDYLPEFEGSSYEGVSVRHLLQMASGVAWNETYTDPASDRRRMLEAQIAQEPGAILELMAELPRAAPPGTRWNYSTGETHVVGALVRAAAGMPVAKYLSDRIWARFGMEADATWWLEAPDGLEVGGSGLSATLRDYARFGLFLLHDGVVGGERILPPGWVREATRRQSIGGELVPYGYMFWPVAGLDGTYDDAAFAAVGIFGQHVYVNPARSLVVALWSAQSKPVGTAVIDEFLFFAKLAAGLDQAEGLPASSGRSSSASASP